MEHELTPIEHDKQLPLLSMYNPLLHVMQVVESVQYIHPNGHFSQTLNVLFT